jgi:hypothetical protein
MVLARSASIRTIEAAAERMGVAECGVDNAAVRYAEDEFVDTNPRKKIVLGKQPRSRRYCWRCASSSAIRASTLAPSSL